jgi:hypothetical protein
MWNMRFFTKTEWHKTRPDRIAGYYVMYEENGEEHVFSHFAVNKRQPAKSSMAPCEHTARRYERGDKMTPSTAKAAAVPLNTLLRKRGKLCASAGPVRRAFVA